MARASITNVAGAAELAAGDLTTNAATDAHRELLLFVLVLPKGQSMEVCKQIRRDQSLNGLPMSILKLSHDVARSLGVAKSTNHHQRLPNPTATVAGIKKLLSGNVPTPEISDGVIEVEELVIDPVSYRVTRAGKPAMLTMAEFQLLYYLAARPNRPFTRDELVANVWSNDRSLTTRIVDVYVRRVRLKIEPDPENPVYLKTRRGIGYFFVRKEPTKGDVSKAENLDRLKRSAR